MDETEHDEETENPAGGDNSPQGLLEKMPPVDDKSPPMADAPIIVRKSFFFRYILKLG